MIPWLRTYLASPCSEWHPPNWLLAEFLLAPRLTQSTPHIGLTGHPLGPLSAFPWSSSTRRQTHAWLTLSVYPSNGLASLGMLLYQDLFLPKSAFLFFQEALLHIWWVFCNLLDGQVWPRNQLFTKRIWEIPMPLPGSRISILSSSSCA